MTTLTRLAQRKKGQTALEYALVVAAISLVIMAAWNMIGREVTDKMRGDMLTRLKDNLSKGNGSEKR